MFNSVYREYRYLVRPFAEGASTAALLGLAEHIAFYDDERLSFVARYTLGSLAYYAGIAVCVKRLGLGWLALPIFGILVTVGIVIGSAHLIRHSTPDNLDVLLADGDSNAVWMPSLGHTGRRGRESR